MKTRIALGTDGVHLDTVVQQEPYDIDLAICTRGVQWCVHLQRAAYNIEIMMSPSVLKARIVMRTVQNEKPRQMLEMAGKLINEIWPCTDEYTHQHPTEA
jgi:hypothetical protein